jgi:hypothetical protein
VADGFGADAEEDVGVLENLDQVTCGLDRGVLARRGPF